MSIITISIVGNRVLPAAARQGGAMSTFQKPSRLCPLGLLLGALMAWAGWVSAAEGGGTGANEGYQNVIVDLDALVLSAASRQDAVAWRNLRRADSLIMVDVVEGKGQAWLAQARRDDDDPTTALESLEEPVSRWGSRQQRMVIALRSPDPAAVTLRLGLLTPRWIHHENRPMLVITGTLPENLTLADPAAMAAVRQRHYARLSTRLSVGNLPGSRWFAAQADRPAGWLEDNARWQRQSELERSLNLFTGARAVAENLALEGNLLVTGNDSEVNSGEVVALDSLPAMEQAAIDWPSLQADIPERGPDALAAAIPADQHALFFPNFGALLRTVDLLGDSMGGLAAAMGVADGAGLMARYQQQLALPLDGLTRRLGPALVESVAITGGDVSVDLGSDVALLLRSQQGAALANALAAQASALAQVPAEGQRWQGLEMTVIVNAALGIASYQALVAEDVLVVANHPRQIQRIAAALAGEVPVLIDDHDYRALRQRHQPSSDERFFLMLTDAAIRRWCGAGQRLAEARRIRAHAALSDLRARQVLGTLQPGDAATLAQRLGLDWGSLEAHEAGFTSSVYGSLEQLTPAALIAEGLAQEGVSAAEAQAYRRWHGDYARGFRQWFDPIALQLREDAAQDAHLALSVLPLHAETDFREILAVVGSAVLSPGAGDPHPEAIAQWVVAIDPESPTIRSAEQSITPLIPGLRANPLAWLGGSASLFVDQDPLWAEMAASDNPMEFMSSSWHRLPVALHLAVRDPLQLTVFLTALRGVSEAAAPDLARWSTAEHAGIRYVQITSDPQMMPGDNPPMVLSYAALPEGLWLTLSQPLIERVLERVAAQRAAEKEGAAGGDTAWTEASAGLQLRTAVQDILPLFNSGGGASPAHYAAWSYLPLLNDLRAHFPDEEPLAAYQRIFSRPLASAAAYRWDAELQSMVSTHYGHPLHPQPGPESRLLGPWAGLTAAVNLDPLGNDAFGLRVRLHLMRGEKKGENKSDEQE